MAKLAKDNYSKIMYSTDASKRDENRCKQTLASLPF